MHSQYVLGPSSRRLAQLIHYYRDCRGICAACSTRLGEEQYYLVVPVGEDMMRRREDVGGPPGSKGMYFLRFGGEKARDGV
jgi:hypothetical protein